MKPHPITVAIRPLGFFLYGLMWLVLTVTILFFVWFTVLGPIRDYPINAGTLQNPLTWAIGIPVWTWIFAIAPWWMFSQAMLGFVFTGQALSGSNRDKTLSRLVGSGRGRVLEAVVDTPSTRLWTAVGNIGFSPGWRFAGSSLVLVVGICLARFVDSPVAEVVGWALVAAGTGLSIWAIVPRLKAPAPLAVSSDSEDPAAREKYLKGVAYREKKRARDLQKARDEGQAPGAKEGPSPTAFERWGAAEADLALSQHYLAKRDARLGIPGSLDAAIDAVTSAMYWHISAEEAERFVIDAAAYRGKKPVRVRLAPGEHYPPATRTSAAR